MVHEGHRPAGAAPAAARPAQGLIVQPRPEAIHQLLDPSSRFTGAGDLAPPAARPVPGYGAGREAQALAALTRSTLVEVVDTTGSAKVGTHWSEIRITAADVRGRETQLAPRFSLTSGRWPQSRSEVLVTPSGAAMGLPTSGTFDIDPGDTGTPRLVTVVGTGSGYTSVGSETVDTADVMTVPFDVGAERRWLLLRDSPLTWAEVQSLNTYGVAAYSRYAAEHPETVVVAGLGPGEQPRTQEKLVIAGSTLGLLLLTTLLAGPAFAVSAARQRRTLALAASNGATRAQLRRTVLGQALVLGALSAIVGAVVGVVVGCGVALGVPVVRPGTMVGPIDVPWPTVALVSVAAVVSSVVSALVPARGLGRLDIVSVLRGQSMSPDLRRRTPAGGAILVGVGIAAVVLASFQTSGVYFYVLLAGSVAIVLGAILIVPLLLISVARLSARLPVPVRMAARDAGRQRGRATPTVAAILAGAAVLSAVCIALQGHTDHEARNYSPRLESGVGEVDLEGGGGPRAEEGFAEASRTIAGVAPGLRQLAIRWWVSTDEKPLVLQALRPGCSLGDSITANLVGVTSPCVTMGTQVRVFGDLVLAVDPGQLADFIGLSGAQRGALAHGAILVVDPADLPRRGAAPLGQHRDQMSPARADITDGQLAFARLRTVVDQSGDQVAPAPADVSVVRLPAVTVTRAQMALASETWSGGVPGFIAISTATRLGLGSATQTILLRAQSGISRGQQARLVDAVRADGAARQVYVERGYERGDGLMLLILFGSIGLIILVATLIATALTQAENQPLMGTLAAVGATRMTRRNLAAAQAVHLGLLGAVVGVLVGLVPGLAISRMMTADYDGNGGADFSRAITDVPWLQVGIPVVLVPLLAGALAWVSIRKAPTMTRRAT